MRKGLAKVFIGLLGLSALIGVTSCGGDATVSLETSTDLGTSAEQSSTKKDITGITFSDSEFSYDGEAHSIRVKGIMPYGVSVTYTGNNQVNAGQYEVVAHFNDTTGNYNLPADMTAIMTISKKMQQL